MSSTIESVDKLTKPPPNKRVNPSERSSAEHGSKQFQRQLKKKLGEDHEDSERPEPADAIDIQQRSEPDEEAVTHETEAGVDDGDCAEAAQPEDTDEDEPGHIDVKA
ncbi:MAG: hypothetical protein AB1744_03410 [Candidatus Zixiibacteriota bacterium]